MNPLLGLWIGILLGSIVTSLLRLPISILRTRERPFFFPGWYFSLMVTPTLLYYLYFSLQLFLNTFLESITYAFTTIVYSMFFGLFLIIFFWRLFQEDFFYHTRQSTVELVSQILKEDDIDHTIVKPNLLVQLLYFGSNLSVIELEKGSILIIELAITKSTSMRFKSISKEVKNKVKQSLISIIPQDNLSMLRRATYIIWNLLYVLFSVLLIILTILVLGMANALAGST